MREYRVFRITSKAEDKDVPPEMIYIGTKADHTYLSERFFQGCPFSVTEIKKIPRKDLQKEINQLSELFDLIVVARNSCNHWVPSTGKWMVTPTLLYMVKDFQYGESWEEFEKEIKKGNDRNIRRIKQAGFKLEISHTRSDLDFFISKMHQPYMTKRHSDQAEIATVEDLEAIFDQSEIKFVVTPEGERVAGGFCQKIGQTIFWLFNGLVDGDESWLKKGAVSANYYLGIKDDFERGYQRINLGFVKPFTNDPLYLYKKHWGFRPVPMPWNYKDWLIWAPRPSQILDQVFEPDNYITEFTCFSKNIAVH